MSKMDHFNKNGQFVIGMVHCLPLPGTPGFGGSMQTIIDQAIGDAKALEASGLDAIIVENMGDTPFGVTLDPPQACALAAISALVAEQVQIPVGIDAAMNDYEVALSIAKAVGAGFVRIPVFVDTVEFFGGIIEPCAREVMILRENLQSRDIKIFADIQVKHTHMVLPHVRIEDSAKSAEDCGADAIIVTGTHIGIETPMELIKRVKAVTKLPVIAGSGVNASNIKEQLSIADGAIVGTNLKEDRILENPISAELATKLMQTLRA